MAGCYEMRQDEGCVCSQMCILVKAGVQSCSMKGMKREGEKETDNAMWKFEWSCRYHLITDCLWRKELRKSPTEDLIFLSANIMISRFDNFYDINIGHV